MDAVLHKSLNYTDSSMNQGVKAKSYRYKMSPEGGSSYSGSQDIRFKLPSNLFATYADIAHRTYLKFKITPEGSDLKLEKAGIQSVINRFLIQSQSQAIFDCQNWHVLANAMVDLQQDQIYKSNVGALTSGQGCNNYGQVLADGTTYSFTIPLILNPLTQGNNYLPLFAREEIEIILTLNDIASYGHWAAAATSAIIKDVELVSDLIQLSPQSQAEVEAMSGNRFTILTTGINNSNKNLSNGVLSNTSTVDVNVNFLDKIICCWRPATVLNNAGAFTGGGRCNPSLSSVQLSINSMQYPNLPVKGSVGNTSEFLSETLLAMNMLNHTNHPCSLNALGSTDTTVTVAGTATSSPYNFIESAASAPAIKQALATTADGLNTGSFVFGLNLTSLNQDTNELFNGVSTIGSSVQLKTTHSAMANDVVQDVFCFYNQKLELDMNTDKTWLVSM